jgi:hypothetical protein
LEERSNGKGKLAEASEEGQGPRRTVESMMMMMIGVSYGVINISVRSLRAGQHFGDICTL